MVSINRLSVSVDSKTVLTDFFLQANPGSIHFVTGPNGAGKSSLAYALMGHPQYTVTQGSVVLHGQDITQCAPDERARRGMFLALQQPCALPGVSVQVLLSQAYRCLQPSSAVQVSDEQLLQKIQAVLEQVGLPASYADRAVHEHFSGGEKKRLELAQLLLYVPQCAILDEVDAGLDAQGVELIVSSIRAVHAQSPETVFLIITHSPALIAALQPASVHVLQDRNGVGATHGT